MISNNVTNGICSVVKSEVKHYLPSPFLKKNSEYKLKVIIERKSWLKNLCKEDLETIIEFIHLASSTLSPREVLRLVVKKISEIKNVTGCSMISIDVADQRYAYVVSTSESSELKNLKFDIKKYPEIGKVLLLKKLEVIKDVLKDPIIEEMKDVMAPVDFRSIMVIPVIFRNEVIGILLLAASRAGPSFTKREIGLCTAITNVCANVLYNAFLYDRLEKEKTKLERLAVTDYLTGVYNIRYFYKRLEEEFSRAKRYNIPLSCMMLDIDYFKKINDTYGHRIGDIVLREFAQLVRGRTRKSDIFARYGGEEFIMLLPHTPLKGVIEKAERIRKVVKEYQFMGLEEKDRITVSIGIACYPDEKIKTYDDLIAFADEALFMAKNRGRDQISVYLSS